MFLVLINDRVAFESPRLSPALKFLEQAELEGKSGEVVGKLCASAVASDTVQQVATDEAPAQFYVWSPSEGQMLFQAESMPAAFAFSTGYEGDAVVMERIESEPASIPVA